MKHSKKYYGEDNRCEERSSTVEITKRVVGTGPRKRKTAVEWRMKKGCGEHRL